MVMAVVEGRLWEGGNAGDGNDDDDGDGDGWIGEVGRGGLMGREG